MTETADSPAGRGNLTVSAVALLSLSFFWLVLTLYRAREDIAASDIIPVTAFTMLVLALQIGLLFAFRRRASILLIAFALANTFSLYGVFSATILQKPVWLQVALYAGIALFYFVAFDILRRARPEFARWAWLAPLAVAAMAGVAVAKASTEAGHNPALRQIANVEFIDKPNIYLLSFDAMVPQSLGAKILSIESLPYIDVLKSHGARFIPNVFADNVPTKRSLSSILNLVPDDVPNPDRLVSGEVESPLRAILAANGYQTHFTFWTSFFGRSKGPHLDSYNIRGTYNLCSFLDDLAQDAGFFGYCAVRSLPLLAGPKKRVSYELYAIAHIEKIAKDKSGPHFYMQHFPSPGHTGKLFAGSPEETEKFNASYLKSSAIAARAMDKMLGAIRAFDPKAIVFVYGDHGAWVSRAVKFEDNPELFVLDRWGTLGALIDGGRCTQYLEPPAGERYQTTARIVTSLLTCLSGGRSPFVDPVDFGQIRQLEGERFETYVYE